MRIQLRNPLHNGGARRARGEFFFSRVHMYTPILARCIGIYVYREGEFFSDGFPPFFPVRDRRKNSPCDRAGCHGVVPARTRARVTVMVACAAHIYIVCLLFYAPFLPRPIHRAAFHCVFFSFARLFVPPGWC